MKILNAFVITFLCAGLFSTGIILESGLVFAADKNHKNDGQKGQKNDGQRGQKDDGQKGQKDDGQRGQKDDGQQGQKDDGQQGQKDDGQKGQKDDGQRGQKDDGQRGQKDDGKKGQKDDGQRGQKDDGQKAQKNRGLKNQVVIKKVDGKKNALTVAANRDGKMVEQFVQLDEKVAVRIGNKAGTVADLKPEMRIKIRWTKDNKSIVEVEGLNSKAINR